jgi:hypothetical protein
LIHNPVGSSTIPHSDVEAPGVGLGEAVVTSGVGAVGVPSWEHPNSVNARETGNANFM